MLNVHGKIALILFLVLYLICSCNVDAQFAWLATLSY